MVVKPAVKARAIHVRVERLVLDGFAGMDSAAIGAAVRAELHSLVAAQGLPSHYARTGVLAAVDGGAFRMAPGARPAGVGKGIARAVYGGFGR